MKINKIGSILSLILVLLVFSQCSPYKKLVLFQNAEYSSTDSAMVTLDTYKLKTLDNLYIKMFSQDPVINNYYNQTNMNSMSNMYNNNTGVYFNSYTISDSGYVTLPAIGEVLVGGLKLSEAKKLILDELTTYITDASIEVKISNFKVSIFGEVNNPSTYEIYDNNLTIFDLLARGKYFTKFGDAQNVHLIRKTDKGQIIYKIDLTEGSSINSNIIELIPDDVIYVPPLKAKLWGENRIPFSEIISTITTTVLIINFINLN